MAVIGLLVLSIAMVGAMGYMPPGKEHFLSDALLREVVDRMGKDLADAADVYLDFPESNRATLENLMPGRVSKDLENEEQQFPMDYETSNSNPSIRDQEYLQHSSLWGHQYVTGGSGEGKQRLQPDGTMPNMKEVKSDAALPAYCNPPNPCPIGYSGVDDCLTQFENTAAFSRGYQASRDCMCDSEHMFDCPAPSDLGGVANDLTDNDLSRIIEQFQSGDQHKSLVAKKFHAKKASNPYLKGEKLPVAAKKGINVIN